MTEEDDFFAHYGDLELQRRMVMDHARTEAFARAIVQTVESGDRVLDLGCGTGILAMVAARAGGEVVAVDRSAAVGAAARVIERNGLKTAVHVIGGDVDTLQIDPVDVLVSEWLGNFAFVENMWATVARARARLLAPGGKMIPRRVHLALAPIDDAVLYFGDGPGQWRNPVQGFDFSDLEHLELAQGRTEQTRVEPAALSAPRQRIYTLDCQTDGEDSGRWSYEGEFVMARAGALMGFAGWFEAELAPGVVLDTGPSAPATHWAQTFLPLPPRPVTAGQRIAVTCTGGPDPDRNARISLTVDGEARDFRLE